MTQKEFNNTTDKMMKHCCRTYITESDKNVFLDNVVSDMINNEDYDIKQVFQRMNNYVSIFKTLLYNHICDENFQKDDCYIDIINENCIEILANSFNNETINKINEISTKWSISPIENMILDNNSYILSINPDDLYKLKISIDTSDWLNKK